MWVDVLPPLPEDPLALAADAVTVDERRACARLLATVGTRDVSPALGVLDRLSVDDDVDLRLAVGHSTWRLAPCARPSEVVPLGARLARDPDRRVRRMGLRVLLACPSTETDRALEGIDLEAADPGRWLMLRLRLRSLRAARA